MSRRSAAAIVTIILLGALGVALWLSRGLSPGDRELRFVSTIAGIGGEFGEPFGIAAKGDEVYLSDGENGTIWRLTTSDPFAVAKGFHTPSSIAFDNNDNLIVADSGSHTIKSVAPNGEVSIIAGVENRSGFADGDVAVALFNAPIGVAVIDDKIAVADTYNDRIRIIENGKVSTLAGSVKGFADGPDPRFDTPCGIAVWHDKLLVADAGNRRIRAVEPDGRVWTFAGNGEEALKDGSLLSSSFVQPTAIAVDADNTIFLADGNAIRKIGGVIPAVRTISDQRQGTADGPAIRSRFNRPSGLAFDANGSLLVADSDNRLIRRFSHQSVREITAEEIESLRDKPADFRAAAAARWPYDPPLDRRDIAGTMGEIRGEMKEEAKNVWFHNGLDIAGAYGETARFIRDEKVLLPIAVDNFATSRELIRMPKLGYVHIRLGRHADSKLFGDPRFLFDRDANNKLTGVRVPRGAEFKAGEPIGTLNSMNHVHLVAGRAGSEMNALDALSFPNLTDTRPPVIEEVSLYDENWDHLETVSPNERIKLSSKVRVVVKAYDQMDGNSDKRRLGIYRIGWGVRSESPVMHAAIGEIRFDRLPPNQALSFVYANESKSGATGETIFRYIATNFVSGDRFAEEFFDAPKLDHGNYTISVFVSDYFGNLAERKVLIEVIK